MSNALAIAGVTAVLRDLLNDGLINHNVSGVLGSTITVTAFPPDRVVSPNSTEGTQLNVFLRHVTPNSGWRNESLPSRDGTGRQRLTNPPLALDLHYLISAYGSEDLHAEILLGYAMQLLHETPVLTRAAITTALNPSPPVGDSLPAALRALAGCGLADQHEPIRITPEYLSTEEISKLWTAAQTHYRPTAAYLATVVLIESVFPTRLSLPVLSRGPVDPGTGRDRGVVVEPGLLPPFPTLESVSPVNKQPSATVGSLVEASGHHLNGTMAAVVLKNSKFNIEQQVPLESGSAAAVRFVVPDVAAGIYQISLSVVPPEESEARVSNELALVIGPAIVTPLPADVARDASGTATIVIDCAPQVRPEQRASLVLGTREVPAEHFTVTSGTLAFVVEEAPAGTHLARLRVDGIESPLIDRAATPPVFFDYRITIT